MSKTKEFLEMCAATAGCVSVNQYLRELEKDRERDAEYEKEMERREVEEYMFWKSVDDGSYFEEVQS